MFTGLKSSCFYCPSGEVNRHEWVRLDQPSQLDRYIKYCQDILKIKEFSSTLHYSQALLVCLEALPMPLSLFKDFSRQAFIFKYFSFLYEPWQHSADVDRVCSPRDVPNFYLAHSVHCTKGFFKIMFRSPLFFYVNISGIWEPAGFERNTIAVYYV